MWVNSLSLTRSVWKPGKQKVATLYPGIYAEEVCRLQKYYFERHYFDSHSTETEMKEEHKLISDGRMYRKTAAIKSTIYIHSATEKTATRVE
jgi:hypothetical protein